MPPRWIGRLCRTAASLCLLLVLASQAHADELRAGVVVLPMTSTKQSLQIYQTATSTALAQRLGVVLGTRVTAVSSASDVPKSAKLIVDGRLVAAKNDRLMLEARVRGAGTGQALGTVSTFFAPSTDIDRLVASLADKLAPVVRKGLAPARAIRLPTAYVRGAGSSEPPVGADESRAPAQLPTSPEPDILLIPAGGSAAKGVVSVRQPATSSAQDMLARMGLVGVDSSSLEGLADPAAVLAEMARTRTRLALMVHVRRVRFSYNAVLSARGSVRVVLLSHDQGIVLDKTVSTDTVVGSRGDRHQALVYRVVDQAFDILIPKVRGALRAGQTASAEGGPA